MSKVDLVSRQWCELVFEGRNKEYGAYRLRSKAGARNLKSLITLFLAFAAIVAVVLTKVAIEQAIKANNHAEDQVTEFAELEQKKEENISRNMIMAFDSVKDDEFAFTLLDKELGEREL